MACLIDAGAVIDCANILQGGLEKFAMIYNFEDFQKCTLTEDATDGFVTSIVNGSGVQAFKFEVPTNSGIIPTSPLRQNEKNIDTYDHQVDLAVYGNSQAIINNVDKMRVTPVVVVLLRTDGYGMIYGRTGGLLLEEVNYNPQEPNEGAIIPIVLKTKADQSGEPNMPVLIFDTDEATTRTLIKGLDTPGV